MYNIMQINKLLIESLGKNWDGEVYLNPHNNGYTVEIFSRIEFLNKDLLPSIVGEAVKERIFQLNTVNINLEFYKNQIENLNEKIAELEKYKIYFELEKELRSK